MVYAPRRVSRCSALIQKVCNIYISCTLTNCKVEAAANKGRRSDNDSIGVASRGDNRPQNGQVRILRTQRITNYTGPIPDRLIGFDDPKRVSVRASWVARADLQDTSLSDWKGEPHGRAGSLTVVQLVAYSHGGSLIDDWQVPRNAVQLDRVVAGS